MGRSAPNSDLTITAGTYSILNLLAITAMGGGGGGYSGDHDTAYPTPIMVDVVVVVDQSIIRIW